MRNVWLVLAAIALVLGCNKEEAATAPAAADPAPAAAAVEKPAATAPAKEEPPAAAKPAPEPAAEPAAPTPAEQAAAQQAAFAPTAPAAPAAASTNLSALAPVAASALPQGLGFRGKADSAVEWTDHNGRNVAVFSHQGGGTATTLFLNHYVEAAGQWKNLREVKEHVPCEDFDLTAEFVADALELTDLDADQIGELTFAYKVGCRSDISPIDLKLLMIENGDKYIIRGQTKVDAGEGDLIGGDYKIDPSLTNGPKAFLDHAVAVWPRIVKERFQ